MISHDTIFISCFSLTEKETIREKVDDKYIKVTNDIVTLMAHLYQMKNRMFVYPRLCSFFYHSNIKYNHEAKALTNTAQDGKRWRVGLVFYQTSLEKRVAVDSGFYPQASAPAPASRSEAVTLTQG